MGVAGDPFRCRNWEPKTPQQEERLERWLKETRPALLLHKSPECSESKLSGSGPGIFVVILTVVIVN